MMTRRFLVALPFLLFFILRGIPSTAQDSDVRPLVVMNVAAHPDDEDGATLAYYRHAKDAIAYSAIYTRGEGGQNEIGPELYEELGALRTDETERAARILGTQVYFLNFKDFGYSKSAEETFTRWGGRDKVTARIVYLVRKLKPDVMFTNHDTVTVGPRRQHGHHQAVGLSAYDAFELAADPAYHPEQLDEEGVDLWQPKRLFLRLWRGGDHEVTIPVGSAPEARPAATRAAEALREHASQGMDQFASRIAQREHTYFVLLRSSTDAPLDPDDLAGNLPPNTTAQPDLSYWIDSGRIQPLPDGTLTLNDDVAVPGQRVEVRWDVGQLPTRRLRWRFTGAIDTTLYLSDTTPGIARLTVDPSATPTVPKAVYQYERFVNHPPVVYAAYRAGTDELLAAGYLPLEVAPPLHLEPAEEVTRLHAGPNRIPIRAHVYDPAAKQVELNLAVIRDADQDVIQHQQTPLSFDGEGLAEDTLTVSFSQDVAPGDYTLTMTALASPSTSTSTPARAEMTGRVFDVKVPSGLKVGVIQSYDNTMERAMQELGVEYAMLDSLDLAHANFGDLHTVIVDIRAYLVRQDLRMYNDQLLEWVKDGGHLVVNYQKVYEWNPDYEDPFREGQDNPDGFAPYPLRLGRERVTREDAPVEVLKPEHLLLNAPNPITEAAWDGWVQERGLYFPAAYDGHYEELFCMHDPGEDELCNSTLLARYGEGTYLYTALVWYRQLKVYHPGGYDLFANLISLPLVEDDAPAGSR